MRPETEKYLAAWLRHAHGEWAAIEKWVASVPPENLAEEIAHVAAFARAMVSSAENRLGPPKR